MDVIFNELALEEFNDAISYYELEVSGLGNTFKEKIRKAIKRITEYPKAWSVGKFFAGVLVDTNSQRQIPSVIRLKGASVLSFQN